MHFIYNIAEIVIKGETPYDMILQEESIPFLSEMAGSRNNNMEPDEVTVIFNRQSQICVPEHGGTWKMNRLYYREGNAEKVYFFAGIMAYPYACVSRRKGKIYIDYTEESIRHMNYSHNLIDLLSMETLLMEHGGIVVHASFIRWRECGILFAGPSGSGKSTQADLWNKYEQAECLNGDRTALRMTKEGWKAYGLPYAGTSGIYRNESVGLTAVVILRQDKENTVFKMNPVDAFQAVYAEVMIHHWDEKYVRQATDYLTELVTNVPFFLLSCRPDRDAVNVLKDELMKLKGIRC